jgi:hypothetical protein
MKLVKTTIVYPNTEVKDFLCWNKFGNGKWRLVIRNGGPDWMYVWSVAFAFALGLLLALMISGCVHYPDADCAGMWPEHICVSG